MIIYKCPLVDEDFTGYNTNPLLNLFKGRIGQYVIWDPQQPVAEQALKPMGG